MITKKEELKLIERKVTGSLRSNTFNSALWVHENEAKYLMSGLATELIEQYHIPRVYDSEAWAKIYGVVASDKEKGRYVWLYLHYGYHLWRCQRLQDAFELIEKLKEHNKLEKEAHRVRNKVRLHKDKLQITNN